MILICARKYAYLLTLFVLSAAGALLADDMCELTITSCPQDFNGQTITVPDNIVKLSSLVHACNAARTLTTGTGGTSSILFVIDNTGSMKGNGGNDPGGARFSVTKALLDTIMAKEPNAEVGLVVFREHLFFDTTTTEYYTQFFKALHPVLDNEPRQAYLPFLVLNQTYQTSAGPKMGIDIIKDILTTNSAGDDLVYQPSWPNPTGGETNINGAIIAAKQEFLSAKNPAANQYTILMTDGEPTGRWQAGYDSLWFSTPTGVAGLPTTFTVFFNKQGQAPACLTTMTNNVKINGYSSSNPESNIWALSGVNYSTLMSLLMTNVIQNILVGGNPTKMVLNNKTSAIYLDSSFFFTDTFPLTSALTTISMGITYRYVNPQTNMLSDTIVQVSFSIKRDPTVTTLPSGLSENCTPGAPGTVPVTAILLDTNQDGYLDRIDLTWTDTSAINPTMPSIAQFIKTLQITALDGKTVNLNAVTLVPDLANKTIHVILQENSGPELETGWQSANVTLTQIAMTVSGGPFVVTKVVDGALPVIKSLCFSPAPAGDSLRVIFSEPVASLTPPLDPNTIFTLYMNNAPFTFTGTNPKQVIKNSDNFIYVFDPSTPLTGLDTVVEGKRPKFPLSLCGGVSIVKSSIVIGNPFVPGKTLVPVNGPTDLRTGTRIEITLVPSIIASLKAGKVKGTISIFDVVGNLVANDTLTVDQNNVKLFYFWNGKTSKGMMASAGTYLGRVFVEDLDQGKKQNIRLNIGIKGAGK
ncbi:MAG TPA: VWA domain-containing protein [Chitinivibrionales bacterium]|nr:VWA domain-containing protein [Chitinivibrionales bacterium]